MNSSRLRHVFSRHERDYIEGEMNGGTNHSRAPGNSSMFDYCTAGLGYSTFAAILRIRTARCVARFPEVCALLESNQVNVSTVAQVSRILTPENKDEILSWIRGKSQREVEAIVAEYEPLGSTPRDRVRTVVVRVPVASTAPRGGTVRAETDSLPTLLVAQGDTDGRSESNHNRNGWAPPDTMATRPAGLEGVSGAAKLERRALVQFSASEAFMTKLERVRSLAWHRLPPNASLEQVFELALDVMIDKEDPHTRCERRERRARRERRRESKPQRSTEARHIPAAVRDAVHVCDNGRCTFVGPNGRRCASTRALQVDHIKPVAFGGAGTPDNLRLLCAYHNRLEAERLLGSASRRDRPGAAPG